MHGVVAETQASPLDVGPSGPSGEDAPSVEVPSGCDGRFTRFHTAMETPQQQTLNECMILPAMPPPARSVWVSHKSILMTFMLSALIACAMALNPLPMISAFRGEEVAENAPRHQDVSIAYTVDVEGDLPKNPYVTASFAYNVRRSQPEETPFDDAIPTNGNDGPIDRIEQQPHDTSNDLAREHDNTDHGSFLLIGQTEWHSSSFHEQDVVKQDVGPRIQIAMLKQKRNVDVVMKEFSKKFDYLLQDKRYIVGQVEMKGILFHVVYIGPFEDEEAAAEACREIQRRGSDCVVAS
jgi:hypothetical protein